MEEVLLRHARLPRPTAPTARRSRRLRVVAVALRTRPTSLAVPGLPSRARAGARARAAAVAVRGRGRRRGADRRGGCRPPTSGRAAGMCPELLSVPVGTITAALRFLTDEAGVPAEDLPRVLRRRPRLLVSPVAARLRPTLYFLRALGVPDLPRRADLLSFSVEDKLLPRIEFLESLGLPFRAARSMARRFPGALLLRHRRQHAAQGGVPPRRHGPGRRRPLRVPGVLLLRARHAHSRRATRPAPRGASGCRCRPCSGRATTSSGPPSPAASAPRRRGGGRRYGTPTGWTTPARWRRSGRRRSRDTRRDASAACALFSSK
ncbi:hypothetical protein OsJ_10922 [Oryza sativa Japonica Group]|uniref:Uncharacterized protein n=1 Tax=Oryza sativa subsp. japonica TaxID=39947 RepID=A3AI58_ORYSJ|nr:hypothetical protein OsJ_10922 [Oryza sativa Japonica Group]